ncbi:MAG: multidrug efflux MFS transporter [Lentisphaerae bacterium]|nr:multidrug efflux MFS transporter [Lentisphaerota bacterium]
MLSSVHGINWKRNLFFIWLSQFLALAGFSSCMPFIPKVMEDYLGISDQGLRLQYISAYSFASMLSMCVALVFWGMLADRFGRKIMLMRAAFAAALFYPLLAWSPNILALLLLRFICSFFSGTYNPAQTLAVTSSPKEHHGFVLGVVSTALWSGYTLGYLFGGVVAEYFGIKTAFATGGALYFISGMLVLIFVKENFNPAVEQKKLAAIRKPFREMLTPGVCGVLLLVLLMSIGRRIGEPFLPELVGKVMQNEKIATLDCLVIKFSGSELFFTGIISAAASLGGFLSGVVIGWLCDRILPRKLLFPVLVCSAAGVTAQVLAPDVRFLMIARFFSFFAAGGIMPILQLMLTKITRSELRGTFFGWSGSLSSAGGVLCAGISWGVGKIAGLDGIYWCEAAIYALMVPMLIPISRMVKKELIEEYQGK